MDEVQKSLLEQASEWRLLSLLFSCPGPDWRESTAALGAAVRVPSLAEAARLAVAQGSEELYYSVFLPAGPVSAREVSYRGLAEFGGLLSELRGYYYAFAYLPDGGEAPDHVAAETGFLAWLKMKQAYALASGAVEQAAITAEAVQSFIRDHLSSLALPLKRALSQGRTDYLALAAEALAARAPSQSAASPN